MRIFPTRITLFVALLSLISFSACQKKTSDLMSTKATVQAQKPAIDKSVGYFKFGLIDTEVIDSTGEMVMMMDMMVGMMTKDMEKQFMVNGEKLMEFETDVTGNLTNFSIIDKKAGTEEAFGELDMEKVYTVYALADVGGFNIPEDANLTLSEDTKTIHGYDCKALTMSDDRMTMIVYFSEELPFATGLPEGKSGFPLEMHMIMGGVNIITGIQEYNPKLPHPEYFKVDKTQYREVTNDEFPKKRSMF